MGRPRARSPRHEALASHLRAWEGALLAEGGEPGQGRPQTARSQGHGDTKPSGLPAKGAEGSGGKSTCYLPLPVT